MNTTPTPRKINSTAYAVLFRQIPTLAKIGLVFIVPGALLLGFVAYMMQTTREPYEKYDYKNIIKNGVTREAVVTRLDVDCRTRVNGSCGILLEYEYSVNGKRKRDRFKAVQASFYEGDTISIRQLGDESVVMYTEQFRPAYYMAYLVPGALFGLGLLSLLFIVYRLWRGINLYKHGLVRQATVVSVMPQGEPSKMKPVTVHYFYHDLMNRKIFGYSDADGSLFGQKKVGDTIHILAQDDDSDSCVVPKIVSLQNNWNILP